MRGEAAEGCAGIVAHDSVSVDLCCPEPERCRRTQSTDGTEKGAEMDARTATAEELSGLLHICPLGTKIPWCQ